MTSIKDWSGVEAKEAKTHYKVYCKNGVQLLCLNDGTVIPMQICSRLTSEAGVIPKIEVTCFVNLEGQSKSVKTSGDGLTLDGIKLPSVISYTYRDTKDGIENLTFTVECELVNSVIE